jgi:hypothetical protein
LSAELVLVLKFESPPYTAVIECDPTDSAEVEKDATPPLSVPVPSVVMPSLKVTVPDGLPAPGLLTVTVAVNVTDCPNFDGFALEVSVVDVSALFTTWLTAELVLPLKLVSPPYTAVIECEPTARLEVENVA